MSKESVNKQLANRLNVPEADPVSLQASEALLGLFETQLPGVATVTPNQFARSNQDEDIDDVDEPYNSAGTYQLGQYSSQSTGCLDDSEDSSGATPNNVRSSSNNDESLPDLPVGWMTSTLQDMEETHAKKVKELTREISILKRTNQIK